MGSRTFGTSSENCHYKYFGVRRIVVRMVGFGRVLALTNAREVRPMTCAERASVRGRVVKPRCL